MLSDRRSSPPQNRVHWKKQPGFASVSVGRRAGGEWQEQVGFEIGEGPNTRDRAQVGTQPIKFRPASLFEKSYFMLSGAERKSPEKHRPGQSEPI
jgi:hypothetical protein